MPGEAAVSLMTQRHSDEFNLNSSVHLSSTRIGQGVGVKRRVYVVILDGLRTEEVSEALTPTLLALRNDGTYFPHTRSPETIPDHVTMLAPVLERLPALGFRTCSVLPDAEHPADAFTSHALHTVIDETDPDLVLVTFGDRDPPWGIVRSLAVRTSDEQVGKLVRHLKATGRWERSVLLVVAGGSAPSTGASLQSHINADSLLRGKVVVAQDQLHWTGPASDRAVALRHLESVVSRVRRPATGPVPLLVAGGDPVVGHGVCATPVSTVDVAPTVGRLFGLPEPPGGYDGRCVI
jgi:hypothetical protein